MTSGSSADVVERLAATGAEVTARVVYVALSGTVTLLPLLFIEPPDDALAIALAVFATALVFAAALFPPDGAQRDFGDVLFLASLPFVLGFGVRLFLSMTDFAPVNAVGVLVADPAEFAFDEYSVRALALGVACWTVLFVAYRFRLGRWISSRLPDWPLSGADFTAIRAASILFAAIGWAARVATMVGGQLSEVTSVGDVNAMTTLLLWLSFLTTAATTLALFAVFYRRADGGAILLAALLVLGEVIAGLITGSRTMLFTPLVALGAMAYLTGRIHLRLGHLVLVPALLVVLGVTDTYRNPGMIFSATADDADTAGRVELAVEESASQGPAGLAARGAFNVVLRYHGLHSVAQILRLGAPADLSYGMSYLAAVPAAVVPRFLWQDKPLPQFGVDFGRTYFGLPETVGVSIAPTWIGDLLLNLPLPLVPVGMGVLGVLLRSLREYGRNARRTGSFAVLAYVGLLPLVVQSDGWISTTIWEGTQAIVVLMGAVLVVRMFTRGRSTPKPIG
jgi:hypothetical protein